jgi:hypothetical protein
MNEVSVEAYLDALKSMRDGSPKPLIKRAQLIADDLDGALDVSAARLAEHLCAANANDLLLRQLGLALFSWDDRAPAEAWTAATEPNSPERRVREYELLGLDGSSTECVDIHFPPVRDSSIIISTTDFQAWYPPPDLASRAFYWDQYKNYLIEAKHWSPDSVSSLDEDTHKVVERISDPTRVEAMSARGLVVGYVQS